MIAPFFFSNYEKNSVLTKEERRRSQVDKKMWVGRYIHT